MNDLIEELLKKYSTEEELFDVYGFPYIIDVVHLEDFKRAAQTACKAQRNACLRKADEFGINSDFVSKDSIRRNIEKAEIKRCDYE